MTENHSTTPSSELWGRWYDESRGSISEIATKAAQWGADQELEACCEYLVRCAQWEPEDVDELRAARRPEPPSLKEEALKELAWVDKNLKADFFRHCEAIHTLRRALESIPDPS